LPRNAPVAAAASGREEKKEGRKEKKRKKKRKQKKRGKKNRKNKLSIFFRNYDLQFILTILLLNNKNKI
jgi:hypothetical protein